MKANGREREANYSIRPILGPWSSSSTVAVCFSGFYLTGSRLKLASATLLVQSLSEDDAGKRKRNRRRGKKGKLETLMRNRE